MTRKTVPMGTTGEKSGWRCARCRHSPGLPVTWLWRNLMYGTALVTCPTCGWKWQEPGWKCIDGVWVDTHLEMYADKQGFGIWTKRGREGTPDSGASRRSTPQGSPRSGGVPSGTSPLPDWRGSDDECSPME